MTNNFSKQPVTDLPGWSPWVCWCQILPRTILWSVEKTTSSTPIVWKAQKMKPAKFDPRHYYGTKVVVSLFVQQFQKYFLILYMAEWNDFVGRKTALSTETLYGPYRSRTVGPLAMAAPIHFRLYFLNMGCSIQSSLAISGTIVLKNSKYRE